MRKLDFYWMSNPDWVYQKPNGRIVLRDDAPEEARKSYEHYREQKKGMNT